MNPMFMNRGSGANAGTKAASNASASRLQAKLSNRYFGGAGKHLMNFRKFIETERFGKYSKVGGMSAAALGGISTYQRLKDGRYGEAGLSAAFAGAGLYAMNSNNHSSIRKFLGNQMDNRVLPGWAANREFKRIQRLGKRMGAKMTGAELGNMTKQRMGGFMSRMGVGNVAQLIGKIR